MESARKIKDKPQFFMQNIFLTNDTQGTDFSTVYLLDLFNRTLHVSIRSRHVPQRAEATINAVREVIIANPHTSTRSIGYNLQLDQSSQNKKKILAGIHLKDIQHKNYFPKICLVEKLFVIDFQSK